MIIIIRMLKHSARLWWTFVKLPEELVVPITCDSTTVKSTVYAAVVRYHLKR